MSFEIAVLALMLTFGGTISSLLAIIVNLLWRRLDRLETKVNNIEKLIIQRGEA